jgi:hypothetical protein
VGREPFLIEELRNELLLPSTDAFETLLNKMREKREDVRWEFNSDEAIINRTMGFDTLGRPRFSP